MRSERLSAKERAAMFALLAEARELSNPQLEELFGFRLDGKERRRLNELKLVASPKPGRAYVHELTDAGWRWCNDELSAGPGEGRGSKELESALYGVLARFGRFLDDTGRSLADVFTPSHEARPSEDVDVEARIKDAYRALAHEPGEFVKLSELRPRLAGVPRADVDAALDRMYQAQQVNLVPQADQQILSDAERESGLRVGRKYKHLISIEQ